MKAAIIFAILILSLSTARATEEPAAPTPTLRGVKTVNVHVVPDCSFVDFQRAAAVIEADARKALVGAGIEVVAVRHDSEQPTLGFVIHCDNIRWEGGPVLGVGASAMMPEGAGGPFIYIVSAQFSRRVAVPGNEQEQSDGILWSWDGRLRTLSRRPFVTLREDVLYGVEAFIAEWEKARATATR